MIEEAEHRCARCRDWDKPQFFSKSYEKIMDLDTMLVCNSCFDEIGGPFYPTEEQRNEIMIINEIEQNNNKKGKKRVEDDGLEYASID